VVVPEPVSVASWVTVVLPDEAIVKVLPLGVMVTLLPAANVRLPVREFKLVTTSVVGKVWPGANEICPVEEIDNPVSAVLDEPDPKSKFNVPDGLAVSLSAGSDCHWNVSLVADLELLLKADAVKVTGSEVLPAVAVAVPVEGNASVPLTVPPPLTSRVVAGVVVPIPTFAVLPLPV
jgi:hypothetical protein